MEENNPIAPPEDSDGPKRVRSRYPFAIRGIVIPVDWDDAGSVISISILTSDEDEYLVHWDEKGKQLLPFIREEVEATGVLESRNNKKFMRISHFRKKERMEADNETPVSE